MAITQTVEQVTPELTRVRYLIANSFLWGASEGWVLIDAGLPGSRSTIVDAARERFGPDTPPEAIILTHGHFDHRGAFPELFEDWDVPVYAHPVELPHLTGQKGYPPPDPTVGGGVVSLLSFAFPASAIDLGDRVRALPADRSVPGMPGWRWLHTPGHTDGHVSLFRDADRCLIAGDAFTTLQAESIIANITLTPKLHRPPAYFTPDWPSTRVSIEKLAELHPAIVATGHGQPLYGPAMQEDLLRLAYEFERLGLPPQGRYREIPALYDAATGLTRVPPVPVAPYVKAAGVLFVLALAIMGANKLRNGDEG